jgi:hypothetical protein
VTGLALEAERGNPYLHIHIHHETAKNEHEDGAHFDLLEPSASLHPQASGD